jgi:hypothetical protein
MGLFVLYEKYFRYHHRPALRFVSLLQPFRHLFCNPYCYEYKYFTETVAEKLKKIKFLLKIIRHFSTGRNDYSSNQWKGLYLFKKIHDDVFRKPLRRLWKVIVMVL